MSIAPNHLTIWQEKVPTSLFGATLFLVATLAVFAGVLIAWSALAPISGAVVAQGLFIKAGSNQTIQHRTGGVVAKIHASEGDFVSKGAPILTLDDTMHRAAHERLVSRLLRLLATEARLEAEVHKHKAISFPKELLGGLKESAVLSLIANQNAEFTAGNVKHDAKIAMLKERKVALDQQAAGYRAQAEAAADEKAILEQRLDDLRPLVENQVVARTELLEVKGNVANLKGRQSEMIAREAQTKASNTELDEEIAVVDAERIEKSANKLTAIRGEIAEIIEEMAVTKTVLEEVNIVAPVDGVVVQLNVNTVGGVVQNGAPIGELLPASNPLIVEARIQPDDIDAIHLNQSSEIVVTAFDRDEFQRLIANVSYISADRIVDKESGVSYFSVRLELLQDTAHQAVLDLVHPGMRTEVYFNTGNRTLFQYLIGPLSDSLRRSFREE